MAVKTTLTSAGVGYIKNNKSVWLVDNQADVDALDYATIGSVLAQLSDGTNVSPIHGWTARHETGDWESIFDKDVHGCTSGVKLIIAFSPVSLTKPGAQKFVDAVKEEMEARGIFVETIDFPKGTSLSKIANEGGAVTTEEYLIARIDKAIEANVVKKPTSRTTGETFADRMYDIAYRDYTFHQSDLEEPFVTSKEQADARVAIQFNELEKILLRKHLSNHAQVAPGSETKNALKTIDADCTAPDVPKVALGLRSTRSKLTGNYWFDLGRKDGQMVKITKEGWTVTKDLDSDVYFKRTKAIAEMPIPTQVAEADTFAALQAYRRFANIPDSQWPLVVGWMVTHMIPGYKAPLAFFLGGAGSGKTTLSAMVTKAVEGIDDKGTDAGDSDEDLTVTMAAERIRYMNNISGIDAKLSDLLCKVFEGVKITKRKRYSDSDLVELDITCSVVANGVTVGRMREDLKTRVLALDVNPALGGTAWDGRPWGTTEELAEPMTINQEWDRAHPEALGALFTLMSQVFRYAPAVYMQAKDFRLEEYASVLMVLDLVWQLDGRSAAEYTQLLNGLSEEALDDPLFEGVRRLAIQLANWDQEKGAWVYKVDYGTLKDHFESNRWTSLMDRADGGTANFKTNNSLRDAIIRKETDWKRLGVTVERHTKRENLPNGKKGSMVTFTFQNSANPQFSIMPFVLPEPARF